MDFTTASFQQFLGQKKLMGSKCKACGSVHLPPRPICPRCGASGTEWVELKGKGKIVAFTTVHVAPTIMVKEGFDRQNPYCSGIVQLEEGPKIGARILNIDAKKPQEIKVGTPVTVEFVERAEGESKQTFLAFKP